MMVNGDLPLFCGGKWGLNQEKFLPTLCLEKRGWNDIFNEINLV